MLARYQVELVRQLLSVEEISHRQIAKVTGVSRGAVEMIAAGKSTEPPPERPIEEDELEEPLIPPQRCPTCGGWVYPPCQSCQTRTFMRNHLDNAARRLPMNYVLIVGLDLKPRHFARYQAVRKQRREMEEAVG